MYDDDYYDNDGVIGPDIEDTDDYPSSVRYEDRVLECPNCHKQVYEDNDSCPYCGDIMFRYLQHGTFAPRSKRLAKVIVAIIILSIIFIVFSLVGF